jgi:hypothetical protein
MAIVPIIRLEQSVLEELNSARAFIHCYGFVKYRDVFQRPHRVQLHLRWRMLFGGKLPGQVMEYWELAGPSEENSDVD